MGSRDSHRWAGVLLVLEEPTGDGRVLEDSAAEQRFVPPRPLCLRPRRHTEGAERIGSVLHLERTGNELVGSGTLDLEQVRLLDVGLAHQFEYGEPIGVQAAIAGLEGGVMLDGLLRVGGPWWLHYVMIGEPVWPRAEIRMVA